MWWCFCCLIGQFLTTRGRIFQLRLLSGTEASIMLTRTRSVNCQTTSKTANNSTLKLNININWIHILINPFTLTVHSNRKKRSRHSPCSITHLFSDWFFYDSWQASRLYFRVYTNLCASCSCSHHWRKPVCTWGPLCSALHKAETLE